MKIYYEPPTNVDVVEENAEGIKSKLAQIPGMLPIVEPLLKLINHYYNQFLVQSAETEKFKLMWQLRHLEAEIEAEGGTFTLMNNGELTMEGFSDELLNKIHNVLGK